MRTDSVQRPVPDMGRGLAAENEAHFVVFGLPATLITRGRQFAETLGEDVG